jgi:predicted amidohydrolase
MTAPGKIISVGFLQFDVQLGDITANIAAVKKGLGDLSPVSPCLVVLPELWACGFAYDVLRDLAPRTAEVLDFLVKQASRHGIIVAGSLPEISARDSRVIYNTLYVVSQAGVLGTFRKQHLFSPLGEDRHFTPGGRMSQPVDSPCGKLAGLVCYDLRFPELLRQQSSRGASILLVSAQWPLMRQDHWRTLLMARAIENQMFVVAANRCGSDSLAGGTVYGGHSMIIAPHGAVLQEAGREPAAAMVAIDTGIVGEVRSRFDTSGYAGE